MRPFQAVNVVAKQLNPTRFRPWLRKVWQKLQYLYYALKGLRLRPKCVPPPAANCSMGQ
jgi:hypothetical protein